MQATVDQTAESFMTFLLNDQLFGLDLRVVGEVHPIPEVTALGDPSTPQIDVANGIFHLRDRIVPVIDVKAQLGLPAFSHGSARGMVVVRSGQNRYGLVVDALASIVSLFPSQLSEVPDISFGIPRRFIKCVAKLPEGLAIILSVEELLSAFQATPELVGDSKPSSHQVRYEEEQGRRKVISFRLDQGVFAVDLHSVIGVRKLESYAPVPCSPPHVLGLISVRGSFLTLFDLRCLLGLPGRATGASWDGAPNRSGDLCTLIIEDKAGNHAGLLVDEIGDVLDLEEGATRPSLVTLGSLQDYVEGEAIIEDRGVAILDLKKLMASESLIVKEFVEAVVQS